MDLLRIPFGLSLALFLCGCQLGYYWHGAYHQTKLITSRQPIEYVLRSSKVSEESKRKLRLVLEAKKFGEEKLGLRKTRNYMSYVQLDEPYVTYIVQAAHAYELKPYLWKFPLVGEVPYKGYFRRSLAEEEAKQLEEKLFDTYVRGVTAYSTLGWLQDSVLSSMLRYEDHDLVELILHETVHTTLYIKSAAEFNERMATFLGHEGMKAFYLQKEGPNSSVLARARRDTHDQKLFSKFITEEVITLKQWYEDRRGQVTPEQKDSRLKEIQDRFNKKIKPQLQTNYYNQFGKMKLNNAVLLAFKTYEYNLEDFEKLHNHFGRDFKKTLGFLKTLRYEKNPDQRVKDFLEGGR